MKQALPALELATWKCPKGHKEPFVRGDGMFYFGGILKKCSVCGCGMKLEKS